MCDPVTIGAALSIGGKVAGFMAEKAAVDEQNAQIAAENAAKKASDLRAREAANQEIDQAQDAARMENDRIIADGFERALEGRAAEAEGLALAGSNGVQGISVGESFWDVAGLNYRSLAASEGEMEQTMAQLEADVLGIKAKEAQRIEDNRPDAFRSSPSPLGMMIGIASAGNEYADKKGYYS